MLMRWFYIGMLLLLAVSVRAAEKDGCSVAPLPEGAIKIESCRYKSPKNYTETIKFYKRRIGSNQSYEFKKIIVREGLRAIHIKNNNPSSKWEGLNIYEYKRETRIFVILRADGRSSNGRTTDSGSVYLGSNPSLPAIYGPIV